MGIKINMQPTSNYCELNGANFNKITLLPLATHGTAFLDNIFILATDPFDNEAASAIIPATDEPQVSHK